MTELIVILVIALLVIGPKKLPDVARSIGKGLREFRNATSGLKNELRMDDLEDLDVEEAVPLGDQQDTEKKEEALNQEKETALSQKNEEGASGEKSAQKGRKFSCNIWISAQKESLEEVAQRILVRVRDDGPGMSEELQSRIFEPFFTTRDVGDGLGMGLSICYTIIENHGGLIKVESQPGQYTEFSFDLTLG